MPEEAKKADAPKAEAAKKDAPIPAPIALKRSLKHYAKIPNKPLLGCAFMSICAVVLILVITGLIYHPKHPKFSVNSLRFDDFRVAENDQFLPPSLDITMRADNQANIYTHKSSVAVKVAYPDTQLWSGVIPVVQKPSKKIIIFSTVLQASSMLSRAGYDAIREKQEKGGIPLKVEMTLSVKYNLWFFKSKMHNLDVRCFVVVNQLSGPASTILYNKCYTRWG